MGVLKLRAVGDVWPTAQLLNQQIPTRLQSVELSEDKAETEPGNAAGIHGRGCPPTLNIGSSVSKSLELFLICVLLVVS